MCRELEWATAHFLRLSHDTTSYIVTQGMAWARTAKHDTTEQARRGACDTAQQYSQEALRHGRPASGASGSVRTRGLAAGVCHDTIVCIVTGGRPGVVTQHARSCDTAPSALRHGAGALRHARHCDRHGAQCARQGVVLRYKLCLVTDGDNTTHNIARNTSCYTVSARCDTAGGEPRHDAL